jgi:hypothetical protein
MGTERFCRGEDIELRSIVGEHFLIVLHAGESKMFSLNGMGLWFWNQLERPVSKRELLAAMLAAYEVAEEVAAGEVDRFVAYLMEKGLARRLETCENGGEESGSKGGCPDVNP